MKKQLLTLFLTLILAVVLAVTACAIDIDDDEVFLKQQQRGTCTLVSATMMLRRKAILDADANWWTINEPAVKKVAWPAGLAWNFTYNGLHVSHLGKGAWSDGTVNGKHQALVQMLEAHPEGVVVYSSTTPHAVLLTDYDYNTGIFYCCDPAPGHVAGRTTLVGHVIKGSTQDAVLQKIDQIWYIASGVSNGAGTDPWSAYAQKDEPEPEPEPEIEMARNVVQEVEINGQTVQLQLYALLDEQGNDVNFVKLRELAQALNNSPARFNVGFDGSVVLTTNSPYLADEDSAENPFQGDQPYTLPTTTTTVDGQAVELSAIQLTDEQGGGHTYYNLRDLGKILGYQVEWDPKAGIRIRVEGEGEIAPDEIPVSEYLSLDE